MMAEGEVAVAAFDGDRRQFERVITRALRSKGNLLTLARCAGQLDLMVVERRARKLVAERGVVTDVDRGRALWELLRGAIERLRPADVEPEPTPAWRLYTIAEGAYVQGKPVKEMAAELGLSPRTCHRERRAAVEAVATVVWQIEHQVSSEDAQS